MRVDFPWNCCCACNLSFLPSSRIHRRGTSMRDSNLIPGNKGFITTRGPWKVKADDGAPAPYTSPLWTIYYNYCVTRARVCVCVRLPPPTPTLWNSAALLHLAIASTRRDVRLVTALWPSALECVCESVTVDHESRSARVQYSFSDRNLLRPTSSTSDDKRARESGDSLCRVVGRYFDE